LDGAVWSDEELHEGLLDLKERLALDDDRYSGPVRAY